MCVGEENTFFINLFLQLLVYNVFKNSLVYDACKFFNPHFFWSFAKIAQCLIVYF
jgi:hypothetical protein